MANLINITEATSLLGIHSDTIKKWEAEGRIESVKTESGRRQYDPAKVLALSQCSFKFMLQSRPTQYIFDNANKIQFPFIIPKSVAEGIETGVILYDSPGVMAKCNHDLHCHIIDQDYPGHPACLHVTLFKKKLVSEEVRWAGCGGFGGTMDSWSYEIPRKFITGVIEESWKHPTSSPWRTEWVYIVVEDRVLETVPTSPMGERYHFTSRP